MASIYETQPASNPTGSALGKYYTRLRLGKYKRPHPFEESAWDARLIAYLPLPDQLQDTTSVKYSDTNLEAVGDYINQKNEFGPTLVLRNAGAAISGLLSSGAGALATGVTQNQAVGDFAEKQIGNIFPADKINSALQQSLGATPNPNPAVMFQGPSLRNFSFSWSFYPKNAKESQDINNLILKLKARALPTFNNGTNSTILNYPYMCQLNFFPWDQGGNDVSGHGWTDKSIMKIKKCFMDSVNVRYNPFGTPAFFEGTNLPISYQLTISFKEIEYMTGKDWDPQYDEEATKLYGEFNVVKETARFIGENVIGAVPVAVGVLKEFTTDLATSLFSSDAPPSQEAQARITAGSESISRTPEGDRVGFYKPDANSITTFERTAGGKFTVRTYNNVEVITNDNGTKTYRYFPASPGTTQFFDNERAAIDAANQNDVLAAGIRLDVN